VTGHRGETAEIGHLAVRTGVRCACGRDGCLEAIASAAAIARRYTGLSGSDVTGTHDVAARLSTDAVARQVWQDAVEALAGVTASALGDRGGVIGAALLARDGWAPES
jgi:glucokinase